MRSKTESRRCGCGAILSLRESCPRCAAAERARLHAAGVAYCEEARYQPDAGTFANPAVKQPELTLERIQDAYEKCFAPGWGERLRKSQNDPRTKAGSSPLSQACAAAEEARRLTGVVPYAVGTRARPESPVVYWCTPLKRDWFVKPPSNVPPTPERPNSCNWLHAWGYGGDGCVKFSSGGGWCWTWRVVDGVIVFDEAERMVREHAPGIRGHTLDHVVVDEPRHGKRQQLIAAAYQDAMSGKQVTHIVPDESAREEAYEYLLDYAGIDMRVGGPNGFVRIGYGPKPGGLRVRVSGQEVGAPPEREPPPVGAEVEYAVALEDMKARPEARYRSSIESGTYCFDGRLLYWPESGGVFDSRNSEGFNRTMRWTRLPDATTVPEIGAEVSWEVAKADMMARSEARYRPNTVPSGNVHSIGESGTLLYHVGGGEGAFGPGMHEAKARSHQWTRLA